MEPILILGTGAMACLFAGRLAAAGASVCMLGGWQAGLEALQQRGVTIVEQDGQEQTYPVRAAADPADCFGARLALVLVKSWQTERAARQLVPCLAADGLAVTLQNGLGNLELLAGHLGEARAALGVTTVGARLLGPGRVLAGGDGVTTLAAHPAILPLAEALRQAGFVIETTPDPRALLWGKLVINAAINPLTALLGLPNGELLNYPSLRALLAEAAFETAGIAAALGIVLPYPNPAAAVERVAQRTAANHSSMLQDLERGAPTEIDAISGAVVRAAARLGLAAPVNQTLWRLVRGVVESRAG